MRILASNSLSETVHGGPFSLSTIHLISANCPESMLLEIMKRMRSNIHERARRNVPDTLRNITASSSTVDLSSQPHSVSVAIIASLSQTSGIAVMVPSPVASALMSLSSSPVPGIGSTSVGIAASSAHSSSIPGMLPSPVASVLMSLSSSPVPGIGSTSVGIAASSAHSSSIPGMAPSVVASVSMSLFTSHGPGIGSTSVDIVASSSQTSSISGMASSTVTPALLSSSSSPVPGIDSTSVGILVSSAHSSSIPGMVPSQVGSFSISSPISSANRSSVPRTVSSPVTSVSLFSSVSFVPGTGSSLSFPGSMPSRVTTLTLSASGSSIPGNGSKSLLLGSASSVRFVASTSGHGILASKSVGSRSTIETSVVSTGTLMKSSRFISQAASSSAPGSERDMSITAASSGAQRSSEAVQGSVSVTTSTSLELSPSSKTSVIQSKPLSSARAQTTRITIVPGVRSTAPYSIASSPDIRLATSKVTRIESQVTARESSAIVILPTSTKRPSVPSSSVVATLPSFLSNETFVLVLEGDCSEVTKTEEAKEAFKETFIETVVHKLNLREGSIVVNSIVCGTVRVTFTAMGKRQINVTKEMNKFIDEGTFSFIYGNKTYTGFALEVVHPTSPFSPAPTTVAPKKSRLALILYVTFGSLIGLVFIIAVIVFIVWYRRSKRAGRFLLPNVHYELDGFEGIPRAANYYGEPVIIDATEGSPEQQDEFERARPGMHPYNEHLSMLPVKRSSEPGKQVGAPTDDAPNDKLDLTPVGMPEWNLPKLSQSDMAVTGDAEQNLVKSSDSVGSRKLLLDHSDDVSRDAESAFDNPALAIHAADEESKQIT